MTITKDCFTPSNSFENTKYIHHISLNIQKIYVIIKNNIGYIFLTLLFISMIILPIYININQNNILIKELKLLKKPELICTDISYNSGLMMSLSKNNICLNTMKLKNILQSICIKPNFMKEITDIKNKNCMWSKDVCEFEIKAKCCYFK